MCYAFNGVVICRCYVPFVYVERVGRLLAARGESQRVSLRERSDLHTAKRTVTHTKSSRFDKNKKLFISSLSFERFIYKNCYKN